MTTADTQPVPFLERFADILRRAVDWPGRLAIKAGGLALFGMMGLTVADVVLRNLFAIVVPGGIE
ncbi:MAG: hypothetical protein VYD64_01740, partial [Pseudomonadota bacterium]|nr:hypothetical protein [Pseudomonadota bacterium]